MKSYKKIIVAAFTLIVSAATVFSSNPVQAKNEDGGGKKKVVACTIADENGPIMVGNTCTSGSTNCISNPCY